MLKNHQKIIKILERLKPLIRQKVDTFYRDKNSIGTRLKADNSPVTELDLYISNLFKLEISKQFPQVSFYSEEDKNEFRYPVCVLDPVDGTKEFIAGRDEFVVSFGIYFNEQINHSENFSWIFNPVNGFEISSLSELNSGSVGPTTLKGFVSRTEYTQGLYQDLERGLVEPLGSIAYKLAKLANGDCEFVVSKKGKNLWDILAGTHLCMQNDLYFYEQGDKVTLIKNCLYQPDLLWCREDLLESLSSKLK